jgi:hypothetical protein
MPPRQAVGVERPRLWISSRRPSRFAPSCAAASRCCNPGIMPVALTTPNPPRRNPGRRWPVVETTAGEAAAGEASSLGSLASACAASPHPAVIGIQVEPARAGAVPQARVRMRSALFARLVISWESPGLSRPTPSPGRSSAGTAAVPPSPDSSSPERTGARPSPVLLVCSSRSRSPSPAWEGMAPCSGRVGLPICICGKAALLGEREPPTECEPKEGGSRCHRSGRRRMRRQARQARRGSRSRRRRPRAGSSGGWGVDGWQRDDPPPTGGVSVALPQNATASDFERELAGARPAIIEPLPARTVGRLLTGKSGSTSRQSSSSSSAVAIGEPPFLKG